MIDDNAPHATPAGRPPDVPPRTIQRVELAVFLILIIPPAVLSTFALQPSTLRFTWVAVSSIVNDLALCCLVMYFVWRNGESPASLGWRTHNAWREIALGAILFIPFSIVTSVFELALRGMGVPAPRHAPVFLIPTGAGDIALAFLFLLVVAVAEETIFRGYLILRFRALTGSTAQAVLYSAAVFAIGHGYEGASGIATVALMGGLFAVIYLWRGNLIAAMAIHFLQDFVGVILAPLMGNR